MDTEKYINILRNNFHKISWFYLSGNPYAIELLEENLDKVNWDTLSENPAAIHLLEANPDKIHWCYSICINPAAMHLIEQMLETNPSKINWANLSKNLLIIMTYHSWSLAPSKSLAVHFDYCDGLSAPLA